MYDEKESSNSCIMGWPRRHSGNGSRPEKRPAAEDPVNDWDKKPIKEWLGAGQDPNGI